MVNYCSAVQWRSMRLLLFSEIHVSQFALWTVGNCLSENGTNLWDEVCQEVALGIRY